MDKTNVSESVFDSFLESDEFSDAGLAIFDNDGQVISYNEAFGNLLDLDPQKIIGINILEYLNIPISAIKKIGKAKSLTKNIAISNKYLHAGFCGVFCKDDSNRYMLLLNDKTAEQGMIDNLSSSLEHIKRLIDKFNLGFVILDDNHNILEANKTFCDNLGYTQDEIVKLNAKDYIADFQARIITQKIEENKPFYFGDDNRHTKKNGKEIPVKGYGSVTRINNTRISICLYENISDQVESYQRLETSEMMLKNFISNSSDLIMVLNKASEIVYLSPNTGKVFGYTENLPRAEILDKYLPNNMDDFRKFIKKNLTKRESVEEFEYTIRTKNNKIKYYSVRTSTISVKEKLIICYIRDVTKDKKYIEELKILSYTDQLTKLHNRQYMEEQLLELRKTENFPISIISADLDGLKEVNDSLGHQAGDELLRRFANILRDSHTKYEEIFRIGGDEFLIIATNTSDQAAIRLIKKIDQRIAKHNSSPSSSLKISASVGYSSSDKITVSLTSMLAQADKEMYRIKNTKKRLNNNTNGDLL